MKLFKKEILRLPSENNKIKRIVRYSLSFTDRLCINVMYGDIDILHSHPWNYFTLMLWGGYDETVLIDGKEVTKRRYPGWFSFKKYSDYHRVNPIRKKAITLFIRSKDKINGTRFYINGKVIRDAKYWKSIGCTREQMQQSRIFE
jgi:hypothetical protein